MLRDNYLLCFHLLFRGLPSDAHLIRSLSPLGEWAQLITRGKVPFENGCLSKQNGSPAWQLLPSALLLHPHFDLNSLLCTCKGRSWEWIFHSMLLFNIIKYTFEQRKKVINWNRKRQCCSKGLCDKTLTTALSLWFFLLYRFKREKTISISNYLHWFIKRYAKW